MKKLLSMILIFMTVLSMAVPASAAEDTFEFIDKYSSSTFQVPSDWKVTYEENYVIFSPISGKSVYMSYSFHDLVAYNLDMDAQVPYYGDACNDDFSRGEIADIFGAEASDVSFVTLGGNEYFQIITQESTGLLFFREITTTIHLLYIENGYAQLFCFKDDSEHELFSTFLTIIASADFSDTSWYDPEEYEETSTFEAPQKEEPEADDADLYAAAEKAYYSHDYNTAYELFSSIEDYSDSSKYLRLIRIRNAGSNIGVGSKVYQSACGLTDSDKADIDAAARDFYFADTAEVLLCNSDVACYYLVGEWNGGSKCYIHFKMNNYGGTYNIGSKLSTNYQSTFSINDGDVRVDVTGANTLVLSLTLTGPDCMEVYTHEKNCKTYTLIRS